MAKPLKQLEQPRWTKETGTEPDWWVDGDQGDQGFNSYDWNNPSINPPFSCLSSFWPDWWVDRWMTKASFRSPPRVHKPWPRWPRCGLHRCGNRLMASSMANSDRRDPDFNNWLCVKIGVCQVFLAVANREHMGNR